MSEQFVPKTPASVLGFFLGCNVMAMICGIAEMSFIAVLPAMVSVFIGVALIDEILMDQHPTPPQPEKEDV